MREQEEMLKKEAPRRRRSFWEVLRNAFRTISEDGYRAFVQSERIAEAEKKGETNG